MSTADVVSQEQQGSSLYAALARTATRTIGLYFSRPVRLFRPSKVSGWHSLRGYANRKGHTLTSDYLTGLWKKEGFALIGKHFVPPIAVNALLGTILWEAYAGSSVLLEPHLRDHPIILAASSGAMAGGIQACVAAPVENVRIVVEGGTKRGWSHAWKEVFKGSIPISSGQSKEENMREIRQVRAWVKDVKDMAGRGWDGWGFGLVKDACGFAVFFAIFEFTRSIALVAKSRTKRALPTSESGNGWSGKVQRGTPTVVHAVTLVSGGAMAGLAYEFVSRPLDAARKAVHQDRLKSNQPHSIIGPIVRHLRDEGPLSFFKDPSITHSDISQAQRTKLQIFLRTLSRVGPWGFGFVAWEIFGPTN